MPKMLTIKDAAAETGLTYSCLRRWILEGRFRHYVKAGSRVYINMKKLEEFLNNAQANN